MWWRSKEAQRKLRKPQRVSGELWIGLERKENKTNPNALCFLGGQTVISPQFSTVLEKKAKDLSQGWLLNTFHSSLCLTSFSHPWLPTVGAMMTGPSPLPSP